MYSKQHTLWLTPPVHGNILVKCQYPWEGGEGGSLNAYNIHISWNTKQGTVPNVPLDLHSRPGDGKINSALNFGVTLAKDTTHKAVRGVRTVREGPKQG